ncbi:hypothetical protein JCM10908_000523 [Rhodotorula pacifica]|uniref:uncharacterized protein n=1 Tax=Rhodotorula pacifica TaxID=1495444 RepID=UPI0031808B31
MSRRRSLSVPDLRASAHRRGRTRIGIVDDGILHRENTTTPSHEDTRARHDAFRLSGRTAATTADRGATAPKKRNRVLGGVCGAIALARPKVVLVEASSPDESSDESEPIIAMPCGPDEAVQPPVRFLDQPRRTRPNVSMSDDDVEQSSVRRVLREIEDSQNERAAWSDSAVRGVAHSLSARLAERDRKRSRQDAAQLRRREETKRRKAAALAVASDSEADTATPSFCRSRAGTPRTRPRAFTNPSRAGSRPNVPEDSPPVPTSCQPFSLSVIRHATTQLRQRRTSSHKHTLSGRNLAGSLRRFARRGSSAIRPSISMSSFASDQTRHVFGQPIRHLRRSASTNSLVEPDSASTSSGPILEIRSSGSTDGAGEAVTAPATVGHSGRKPSVVNQNAFITLPPHLHHLLRAPESPSFTPKRPAPRAPARSRSSSSPYALSSPEDPPFSDHSTLEAAKLSLALADELSARGSPSPARLQGAVNTDSSAPYSDLLLLERPVPSSESAASPQRFVSSSRRRADPVGDFDFRHPFAADSSRSTSQRLRSSQSERSQSSEAHGSSSSDLPVFHDLSNLFFRPPPDASRRGSKAEEALETDDSRATVSPRSWYGDRSRIGSSAAWSNGGKHSHPAGCDDGAVLLSPRRRSTRSASTASPPLCEARPAPTPLQQPWSATSFGRLYVGSGQSTGPTTASAFADFPSIVTHNRSLESFLRFQEDGESEKDDGDRASPTSFIDFGCEEPSEHATNAAKGALHQGGPIARSPSPQTSAQPKPLRPRYLSIDSALLISPLHAPSSPYFVSEASRESTLSGKLNDFPAPPSLSPSVSTGVNGGFEFGASLAYLSSHADLKAAETDAQI